MYIGESSHFKEKCKLENLILSIRGVKKHFGGLRALDKINFDLSVGHIMGLMGPNGAGKTTLVNVICGIYKPDAGSVTFEGKDITGSSPHKICNLGIARTYQIPQPFWNLTVWQNVLVAGMYGKGISKSEAQQVAHKVLEHTDLSDKKDILTKHVPTISLKRLEVARALATRPKLLLVDEPAAGLNETELPRMLEILEAIRQDGVTIILIEHVMKVMKEAVDTIFVINEGIPIASGLPHDVMKDEKVVECYLGECE